MKTPIPAGDGATPDDARREFLIAALAGGWLVGGLGWRGEALASVLGSRPQPLPPGRSIFELRGEVFVNGGLATRETLIGPGDRIRTGRGAAVTGVVGADAFTLRGDTELQLDLAGGARQLFRLVTGGMLAVFGKRERDGLEIVTPTATIGIRGTGVFAVAEPERSYVCTCYGTVRIAANARASTSETVQARHHDAPRYVYAEAPPSGRLIEPAPFVDHTDLELMTLEALVGREVPFALGEDLYESPRREY